jgi:hypothetical protein
MIGKKPVRFEVQRVVANDLFRPPRTFFRASVIEKPPGGL